MKISNKDERPPHKKCVEAHEDPKDDWKCVFGTPNIDSHNSKFLWIQSQYDMFLMKRVFYVSCITEGETTYTLSECLPSQIVAIDLTRSFLLQKTLYPLSERGHSVWSNACVWNGALMKSSMYFSDKLRAAVGGRKLTIQEAVEKFVFEDEIIEEVDAYSWPYNSECAFWFHRIKIWFDTFKILRINLIHGYKLHFLHHIFFFSIKNLLNKMIITKIVLANYFLHSIYFCKKNSWWSTLLFWAISLLSDYMSIQHSVPFIVFDVLFF